MKTNIAKQVNVYIWLSFSLLHYLSLQIINLNIQVLPLFLFLFSMFARYLLVKSFSIHKDLAQIMLWSYIEFSLIFFPLVAFLLKLNEGDLSQSYPIINLAGEIQYIALSLKSLFEEDRAPMLHHVFQMGEIAIIILTLCTYSLSRICSRRSQIQNIQYSILPKRFMMMICIFTIFAFSISVLAHYFGLTMMGKEARRLPFKLTGLINYLHIIAIPFFSLYILDILLVKKYRKILFIWLSVFFLWCGLETYIRASRGVFFWEIITIMILLLLRKKLNFSKLLKYGPLVFVALFLIFILTTNYRDHKLEEKTNYHTIFNITQTLENYRFKALKMYQRIFASGIEVIKFEPYLKNKYITNNYSLYQKYGGGPRVHTIVVDQIGPKVQHSSGIGGLSDGYLLFGTMGLLVTVAILSSFSFMIDNNLIPFASATVAGKALLVRFFIALLISGQGTWSFFSIGFLGLIVWPLLFVVSFLILKYPKKFLLI
jgi:hypothetical protein